MPFFVCISAIFIRLFFDSKIMIKCVSGKKVYPTSQVAEGALIEARTQFEYGLNKGPAAIYQCDDCGCFHLTSQGAMNPRLAQYISDGKLKRQKEANRWIEKIKKR